jgi:signal transduction histidine kinase
MKNTALVVLIVASALLVSIIGFAGVVAVRRANRINEDIVKSNAKSQASGRNLEGLRADFDATRIDMRDFMLDPVAVSAEAKRAEFQKLRKEIGARLEVLSDLLGNEEAQAVEDLRAELDGYFESLNQILDADPREFPGGLNAIRQQLTQRREAIVGITRRIEAIDARRFQRESEEIEQARHNFTTYLWRMTGAGVFLGAVIAFVGGRRISALQRHTEMHRKRIEKSEEERRRLSAELVRAQEQERKSISRELHDEVGQTLTALGIEIGNIQKLRHDSGTEFDVHVNEAKDLVHGTLKTVRDMAMGLRPSLLDDSGLVPALRWQIRQYSKRTGVAVELEAEGVFENLGESIGTCVYRVVQEALTNCARHANARHIRVALKGESAVVHLAIQDDGVGFDTSRETDGLGIVGIQERVRDLGGRMEITSQVELGTLLKADIPIRAAS